MVVVCVWVDGGGGMEAGGGGGGGGARAAEHSVLSRLLVVEVLHSKTLYAFLCM